MQTQPQKKLFRGTASAVNVIGSIKQLFARNLGFKCNLCQLTIINAHLGYLKESTGMDSAVINCNL